MVPITISLSNYLAQLSNNKDTYLLSDCYGYIYLTILPDERFYIGQKKGNSIAPNYFGSGIHLNNWFKKNFDFPSRNCPFEYAEDRGVHRVILDYALTLPELNYLERYYIRVLRERFGFDQCLNAHAGGSELPDKKSGSIFTPEQRVRGVEVKRRKAALGLYSPSEETRRRRSEGIKRSRKVKPSWNKGLTKETDERIRQMIERKTPLMEEERQRRSQRGKLHRDSQWFNNRVTQVRIFKGKEPPEGFQRGMLKRKN